MGVGRLASSGAVASIVWQGSITLPKCTWRRRLALLSDAYILGTLHGQEMVFLPRHGRGHRLLTVGAQFPCQYLWTEIVFVWGHLGQCRGQYARDDSSRGTCHPGSIFRSHPYTRGDVF